MPKTAMKYYEIQPQSGSHLCAKGANQGANLFEDVRTPDNSLKIKDLEGKQKTEVWISVQKGANLVGVTKRAIQKNITRGKYSVRKVRTNGGEGYEILLSSLPEFAQIKYWKEYSNGCEETREAAAENPAAPVTHPVAMARFDLLEIYAKETSGKGNKTGAKEAFIFDYNNGKYQEAFRMLGTLSLKTIERWKKRLADSGFDAHCLAPNYKAKPVSLTAREIELTITNLLNPNRPKLSEVIRRTREQLLREGVEPRTDITYRRYIEGWAKANKDIYTIYREGEKAFNDKVSPYVKRDLDEIEVGDIVVADGHTFNFFMIDPISGRKCRMTLILFFDMKSSMPLGFDVMRTENTRVIASALRRTIMMLGFTPRIVYLDNGRAFRGKYFRGTRDFSTAGIAGLYSRLGIQTIYATPYHGQSKTIERFYGVLGEFERRLSTYSGYNIDNKPARLSRNEKLHKRLYDSETLEFRGVIESLLHYFGEYAERKHQEGFYKGETPGEVFSRSLEKVKASPDFGGRLINPEELGYLMLDSEERKLNRNGVSFCGDHYYNEKLTPLVGEPVRVKFDIFNLEEVLVYYRDKFICKASRMDYVHPAARLLGTEEDVEKLEGLLEMKGRIKRNVVKDMKEIFAIQQELIGAGPLESQPKEITQKKETRKELNYGYKLVADGPEIEEEKIYIYQYEKEEAEG